MTEWTNTLFPVDGHIVRCGNRKDLPKKQRIHDYVSMGIDTRNLGEIGFRDVDIFACAICGADKKVTKRNGKDTP
jgi:hypothetical protein